MDTNLHLLANYEGTCRLELTRTCVPSMAPKIILGKPLDLSWKRLACLRASFSSGNWISCGTTTSYKTSIMESMHSQMVPSAILWAYPIWRLDDPEPLQYRKTRSLSIGWMDIPFELFPWGKYGSIMSNNLPKFLLVMRKILRNLASLMRLDSERIRRGWKRYSLGCGPRAETCGGSNTTYFLHEFRCKRKSFEGGNGKSGGIVCVWLDYLPCYHLFRLP